MRFTKIISFFVLLLFCTSIFAVAENDNIETKSTSCGVGCIIWQFLFGNKEARAGKAWFDRSDALVGEAIDQTTAEPTPGTTEASESDSEAPESSTESKIDPVIKSQLESILGGARYAKYAKDLKVKSVYERDTGVLVMSGTGGEIIVDKEAGDSGVRIGKRFDNDKGKVKVVERYIIRDGEILLSQKTDGKVIVGGKTYNFPKGALIEQRLDDLAEGIELPGAEGEPSGFMQLDEGVFTAVNYEEETMQRIKKGESEDLKIDYYKDGEPGCNTDGGCFVPTGGTMTLINNEGISENYLVDYDYKTTFGADRAKKDSDGNLENVEDIELFNPLTGRQEGTRLSDGRQVVALKEYNDKGKLIGYSGEFEVTDKDGNKGYVTRDEAGNWAAAEDQPGDSGLAESLLGEEVAKEFLKDEDNKQLLDDRYSSTQGGLATAQTVLDSIYKITNNIKSYPAISNLLFGEEEFYQSWRSDMDKAFAPLLASNWVPSSICEAMHWNDIEPEGKAVIKTVSGTYQAVASIQMERSPETSPILCHKNPEEDSDDLFICSSRQVCVDEQFCYADEDRDFEPDRDEALRGYFYKITWAVSAPQDEAFTPLRDENGVAVSFNVFLYPGAVPMYNLGGNIASPIRLENGARDKDAIIKYSTKVYDEACIRWNQAPLSLTVPGGEAVEDVCFGIDDEGFISTVGKVNWERAGQDAGSVTVSHGELSRNTDW